MKQKSLKIIQKVTKKSNWKNKPKTILTIHRIFQNILKFINLKNNNKIQQAKYLINQVFKMRTSSSITDKNINQIK